MPKDHYVARTYLRSFCLPDKPGWLNVIAKSNPSVRKQRAVAGVGYKVDWSTNPLLTNNPRLVEQYLKVYEDEWPACVRNLSIEKFDDKTKWFVAGYISYLRLCTPTAARLALTSSESQLQEVYEVIEKRELTNPHSRHREAIQELKKFGGTRVKVDLNYAKSLGVQYLLQTQKTFFDSPWIIFFNDTERPLITSDNPVGLDYSTGSCNYLCALTPTVGIVIHPTREPDGQDYFMGMKPEAVELFNRTTAKCAEENVFLSDCADAEALVEEYRDWRVELLRIGPIHIQKAVKR
jgi:hypothetical protein